MDLPELKLFKRSFVSLVITPAKIQVVKMNSNQTSVEKFVQSELAPGVIMNYRVKNKESLSAVIKETWKKNKIREKYVGVVVPEFSTYTKTIKLPNLTDTEVDEALSWQLQDYLPIPLTDVVMDWKVIERNKEGMQVLVVAILKDVLYGYIDAVGEAGLMPLVVETPSLSIERITDGDNVGKMVIYVSNQEALLLIAEGPKIIASSVVTAHNLDAVVNTAVQMLTHYNKVNLQKILLGGLGITQELVQYLNYNLGRPVGLIDVKIKGMLPAQVQDFLVGISLQRKNPVEPASELTINLLPPSWAAHYRTRQSGIQAWSLTLIASVIIWATFLAVLIVYMFMGLQVEDLQNSTAQAKSQKLNSVASEVKKVNTLADKALVTADSIILPQDIINQVTSVRPAGITISGYKVDYNTGEVKLNGVAENRTQLLAFKNALDDQDKFESVEVPIGSLLQESNINFQITFTYSDLKAAKKKAPIKLKL